MKVRVGPPATQGFTVHETEIAEGWLQQTLEDESDCERLRELMNGGGYSVVEATEAEVELFRECGFQIGPEVRIRPPGYEEGCRKGIQVALIESDALESLYGEGALEGFRERWTDQGMKVLRLNSRLPDEIMGMGFHDKEVLDKKPGWLLDIHWLPLAVIPADIVEIPSDEAFPDGPVYDWACVYRLEKIRPGGVSSTP
ncbi:MAG: hypothetical protein QF593_02370, partial [Nitrospinota bacterium]|nr:hypothetical protein [Nitrospinota bacterium]